MGRAADLDSNADADRGEENVDRREVELKLWHEGCWTLEVTDQHPDTHIIEKSLYPTDDEVKGDLILVSEGQVPIETFIATIRANAVVSEVTVLKQSRDRARVVVRYDRSSSIVPQIVNSDFMPIEPVHITGGYEYWTVLARTDQFGQILQEMQETCDVEFESIDGFDQHDGIEFADAVDLIHDDLSARQLESLLTARQAGYYNWPRDTTATDIAAELDVSGPTFLEHLRSAEQKLIEPILNELEDRHGRLGQHADD